MLWLRHNNCIVYLLFFSYSYYVYSLKVELFELVFSIIMIVEFYTLAPQKKFRFLRISKQTFQSGCC